MGSVFSMIPLSTKSLRAPAESGTMRRLEKGDDHRQDDPPDLPLTEEPDQLPARLRDERKDAAPGPLPGSAPARHRQSLRFEPVRDGRPGLRCRVRPRRCTSRHVEDCSRDSRERFAANELSATDIGGTTHRASQRLNLPKCDDCPKGGPDRAAGTKVTHVASSTAHSIVSSSLGSSLSLTSPTTLWRARPVDADVAAAQGCHRAAREGHRHSG